MIQRAVLWNSLSYCKICHRPILLSFSLPVMRFPGGERPAWVELFSTACAVIFWLLRFPSRIGIFFLLLLERQTQCYGFPPWCVSAFQAWNVWVLTSVLSVYSLSPSVWSLSVPVSPPQTFGCVCFVNFIFSGTKLKDTVLWKFHSIRWQTATKRFGFGDAIYWQGSLCVLVLDEGVVKHYRIRRLDGGGFFLTRRKAFSTLNEFVSYYTTTSDGLCVKLEKPCLKVKWFRLSSFIFKVNIFLSDIPAFAICCQFIEK